MTLPPGNFLQKKRKSIEKSYLGHFYGPRNLCNRSSTLELLFVVLKNTCEFLLSSEIDQFEVQKVDFDDFLLFSNEIPTVGTKGNVMISREILENRPRIEMIYLGAQEEFESVLEHYK